MSHLQIQQLSRISEEYDAVLEAVTQRLGDPSVPRHGHLQRAGHNLETTYIIRLFVEFEGILRDVLRAHQPGGAAIFDSHRRP